MGNPYTDYPGITIKRIESESSKYRIPINMDDFGVYSTNKRTLRNLRPIFGEHVIIDEYGHTGSFISSIHLVRPGFFITTLANKIVTSLINDKDEYFNNNIREVIHEDPEELEFGGYNPLCDTAVYYFIEDYLEFDDYVNYAVSKESQESIPIDYLDDDEDDYDVTDKDGLDFWLFCATLNIKLKPIDCLMED